MNRNYFSMKVIAEKNGRFKKFSKEAWENLSGNTNGWKEVTGLNQTAVNEVVDVAPTGNVTKPKDQVAENEVAPSTESATADQTANNEVKTEVVDVSPEVKNEEEVAVENTDEFYSVAKNNLKKNIIKDYLDMNQVEYKQADNLDTLIALLAAKLENNIELLKTEFAI